MNVCNVCIYVCVYVGSIPKWNFTKLHLGMLPWEVPLQELSSSTEEFSKVDAHVSRASKYLYKEISQYLGILQRIMELSLCVCLGI